MTEASSYLPPKRRMNWRLLFIFAIAVGVISLFAYPLILMRFDTIPREGDVYRVDLKSLGDFVLDQSRGTLKDIPSQFRNLDGKKVALEGFMWNGSSADYKVDSFQFVYTISPPHGHPPLIQNRIFVFVPNGKKVEYYGSDEVRIIGVLHVKIQRGSDGRIISVYTMDLERVEPL